MLHFVSLYLSSFARYGQKKLFRPVSPSTECQISDKRANIRSNAGDLVKFTSWDFWNNIYIYILHVFNSRNLI